MLLFTVNVMYNVKDSFQLQTRKIKIILITIPVQEKFQLLNLRDRKKNCHYYFLGILKSPEKDWKLVEG